MRKFLGYLLAAVFGAAFVVGMSPPAPAQLIFETAIRAEAAPTVRVIRAGEVVCSAVVIAPGYALTAQHCSLLTDAKLDGNSVSSFRTFSAKDVALAIVPGLKCPCATVAPAAPEPGERVSTIGFPSGVAKIVTFGYSQGVWDYKGETVQVHTAFTGPGGSGGGTFIIVNGRALLYGITIAGQEGVFVVSVDVTGLTPQLRGL